MSVGLSDIDNVMRSLIKSSVWGHFPLQCNRKWFQNDPYIEIPNYPDIQSYLGWWGQNSRLFPDMGLMVRDILAVPASGCAVERQFSISGRITIWQRNRLSPRSISDSMIYKGALAKTRTPLHAVLKIEEDNESLPIAESEGTIPNEWIEN